ncbi:MAG: hypothetical protein ACE37F_27945 [Nannocystaceae bacterium]|nr:M10 family metallopeptidase domain-containing protein [bacterium]
MNAALLLLTLAAEPSGGPRMHRQDAPLPPRPPTDALAAPIRPHALGQNTTLYVNFEGVELTECNPSDSRRDCSWYNFEQPFPPFSGTIQTQVGVLQAMRSDVADYGIRVTAQRPESGNYTMVVYGGTEAEYGALGSAPAGDCDDEVPNQIAFAHLDGELSEWVNGGATTALHEAAHSWGLDHIDAEGSIMFPSGNNSPTYFRDECDLMVEDTDLNPGQASCPEVNMAHCGDSSRQNAAARLTRLFGPAYVDMQAPTVELLEPRDGQYFQAPANFDVVFETNDDQHPQAYSVWAWLGDEPRPADDSVRVDPGFSVTDLPIGTWEFHVVVADEAGNETEVDFTIEVGEDPPPDPATDEGCGCRGGRSPGALGWICVPLALARRRRWG